MATPRLGRVAKLLSFPSFLLVLGPLLVIEPRAVSSQETRHMELPYRILEDLQRGTFVGNLFKDAGVGSRYSEAELRDVEFRFLSRPDNRFTIEEDTGILRTGLRIDRDEICPHKPTCTIKLDVVAVIPEPLRFLEIIKVNIEILDLNDNEPRFPESKLLYQVLESAMPGSSFVIPTAIDPDSGDYGIQRYELLSNTDKFELDAKPKVDGSTEVRLVTRQRLDREIQDFYQMKVFAYDGGNPPKSGSVDITVTVQDVNDNDPIFSNATYEVAILENMPPQNTIVRVHANDHDIGLNGQIVYGFSATTQSAYGDMFGIRNSTGEIYVKGVIDYEKNPIYHLSVTARDLSPDSRTADATVIIKVKDANDNAPQITVNTLAATGTDLAEIAEDADLDTFVAHITVTDPDSGRNGQFICSLNDNHFQLEQIYKSEYKIVTRAYLDRETRPEYNLAIACRDRGLEPQVAIKHMKVRVTDVNDNPPVFRQTQYQATLIENNFIGAFIAHVNATDIDSDKNGDVVYSVEPNYRNFFKVNPTTGVVSAAVMFDHEQVQQLKFKVLATDKSDEPRSSVATITVNIDDVNDESPIFSQDGYSFGVFENEPSGTEVGIVHAEDRDSPPYNHFEFSFYPTSDAIDKFVIEPNRGTITTKVVLDREEYSVYYLVVLAIDKGDPPRTSSVTVSVYVSDKNDNPPVFDFPSNSNNTIQISNMVPRNYVVTRIRAHDRDIGPNSNLTYRVTKGSGQEHFSVDSHSGSVTVVSDELKKIDFEVYDLEIMVHDHGLPEQLAKTHLNIVVNHSIAFTQNQGGMLLGHNLMIVVSVACVTGVIVVLLIIAILALKRSGRNEKNGKYSCPKKALTLLSTNDPPKEAEDNCRNKGYETERNNIQSMMNNHRVVMSDQTDIGSDVDNGKDDRLANIPSPPPPPQVHASQTGNVTPAHASALSAGAGHASHPSRSHHHHGSHGQPVTSMRPWVLTQRDVEVHQFLQLMKHERDADSTSSGEGSNTDSGRGPSEEGDREHNHSKDRDHSHTRDQAPHGAHGHPQGHGTFGRGTTRPPTRATESFSGGHGAGPGSGPGSGPGAAGPVGVPHPPPPPMQTFGAGPHGPGPHGTGSPSNHSTPKRVTIAPHALVDPPGKTGSLMRAVPARVVSTEHGPHRTYGYLPARDPLSHHPYSGTDRGYHTVNPRGGNPHQVYPSDRSRMADAPHTDNNANEPHQVHSATLAHPPHHHPTLAHQPSSQGSQGSQGGSDTRSDSSSLQSSYALRLQEAGEISKDVVV